MEGNSLIYPNYTYRAKIVNIIDGDTVDVDIDIGFRLTTRQRLRFLNINTAELHSSDEKERMLAVAAREFVTNEILNKEVVLTTYKSDAFGRYLAMIFYHKDGEQICINDKLLELGLARLYK